MLLAFSLANWDRALEEAPADLGANQWQTFWAVTFPYMVPGIVAGALLALTLSLDDFVIAFFTSGPGSTTFAVKVYSMVRFSVTPEFNAASSILITPTLAATALVIQSRAKRGTRHGYSRRLESIGAPPRPWRPAAASHPSTGSG